MLSTSKQFSTSRLPLSKTATMREGLSFDTKHMMMMNTMSFQQSNNITMSSLVHKPPINVVPHNKRNGDESVVVEGQQDDKEGEHNETGEKEQREKQQDEEEKKACEEPPLRLSFPLSPRTLSACESLGYDPVTFVLHLHRLVVGEVEDEDVEEEEEEDEGAAAATEEGDDDHGDDDGEEEEEEEEVEEGEDGEEEEEADGRKQPTAASSATATAPITTNTTQGKRKQEEEKKMKNNKQTHCLRAVRQELIRRKELGFRGSGISVGGAVSLNNDEKKYAAAAAGGNNKARHTFSSSSLGASLEARKIQLRYEYYARRYQQVVRDVWHQRRREIEEAEEEAQQQQQHEVDGHEQRDEGEEPVLQKREEEGATSTLDRRSSSSQSKSSFKGNASHSKKMTKKKSPIAIPKIQIPNAAAGTTKNGTKNSAASAVTEQQHDNNLDAAAADIDITKNNNTKEFLSSARRRTTKVAKKEHEEDKQRHLEPEYRRHNEKVQHILALEVARQQRSIHFHSQIASRRDTLLHRFDQRKQKEVALQQMHEEFQAAERSRRERQHEDRRRYCQQLAADKVKETAAAFADKVDVRREKTERFREQQREQRQGFQQRFRDRIVRQQERYQALMDQKQAKMGAVATAEGEREMRSLQRHREAASQKQADAKAQSRDTAGAQAKRDRRIEAISIRRQLRFYEAYRRKEAAWGDVQMSKEISKRVAARRNGERLGAVKQRKHDLDEETDAFRRYVASEKEAQCRARVQQVKDAQACQRMLQLEIEEQKVLDAEFRAQQHARLVEVHNNAPRRAKSAAFDDRRRVRKELFHSRQLLLEQLAVNRVTPVQLTPGPQDYCT